MAGLYARTISIHRPRGATPSGTTPSVGDIGYSGQAWSTTAGDPNGEDPILTGLPASIQYLSPVSRSAAGVPTDAHSPSVWDVYIPRSAAGLGAIRNRDIVIDDLGIRYVVNAPYWNILGYRLRVEEEERSD